MPGKLVLTDVRCGTARVASDNPLWENHSVSGICSTFGAFTHPVGKNRIFFDVVIF